MNARFTVPAGLGTREEWFDEHGFTALDRVPEKRPVRELLSDHAAIVTGEPWIGKTYVSKQLLGEASRSGTVGREPFHDRVSLEEGDSAREPRWWNDWRSSSEEAWWIIDALDEALHTGTASVADVLAPFAALRPEQRRRLHGEIVWASIERSE